MKNIKIIKSKYFVSGLITWLLIVTAGVSATPGWTLWGLFELVTISQNGYSASPKYVLNWENIKDESITSYEIYNGTIKKEDLNSYLGSVVDQVWINNLNISTNDTDILNLQGRVSVNETNITSNDSDILTNETNITSNDGDILTNKNNITSNDGDILTNKK